MHALVAPPSAAVMHGMGPEQSDILHNGRSTQDAHAVSLEGRLQDPCQGLLLCLLLLFVQSLSGSNLRANMHQPDQGGSGEAT